MAEGNAFPEELTLKRRREEVDKSANKIEHTKVREQKGEIHWGLYESGLLSDSPDERVSYDDAFRFVLPAEYSDIKDFIENTLSAQNGKAIGIELGGTASNLFGGFTEGFFKRTAGMCLVDRRDEIDPELKLRDERRNHQVIEGDILTDSAKEEVEKFLGENKLDLIIQRMEGGVLSLPREPYFLSHQADFWYQHLAEGGIFFAQIPPALEEIMPKWEEFINKEYEGKLFVKYSPEERGTVLLRKLPGAPDHLPLLPLLSRNVNQ